jgi:hypothetical protein
MKKEKHQKTTVTVRLTDEEDQVLRRLCMLKKTRSSLTRNPKPETRNFLKPIQPRAVIPQIFSLGLIAER